MNAAATSSESHCPPVSTTADNAAYLVYSKLFGQYLHPYLDTKFAELFARLTRLEEANSLSKDSSSRATDNAANPAISQEIPAEPLEGPKAMMTGDEDKVPDDQGIDEFQVLIKHCQKTLYQEDTTDNCSQGTTYNDGQAMGVPSLVHGVDSLNIEDAIYSSSLHTSSAQLAACAATSTWPRASIPHRNFIDNVFVCSPLRQTQSERPHSHCNTTPPSLEPADNCGDPGENSSLGPTSREAIVDSSDTNALNPAHILSPMFIELPAVLDNASGDNPPLFGPTLYSLPVSPMSHLNPAHISSPMFIEPAVLNDTSGNDPPLLSSTLHSPVPSMPPLNQAHISSPFIEPAILDDVSSNNPPLFSPTLHSTPPVSPMSVLTALSKVEHSLPPTFHRTTYGLEQQAVQRQTASRKSSSAKKSSAKKRQTSKPEGKRKRALSGLVDPVKKRCRAASSTSSPQLSGACDEVYNKIVWPHMPPQIEEESFLERTIGCNNCDREVHVGCAGILNEQDPLLCDEDTPYHCPLCLAGIPEDWKDEELAGDGAAGPGSVTCPRRDCSQRHALSWYPEKLLGKCRTQAKDDYYLVKWNDWKIPDSTWEPNSKRFSAFIDAFEAAASKEGKDAKTCRRFMLKEAIDAGCLPLDNLDRTVNDRVTTVVPKYIADQHEESFTDIENSD